MSFRMFSAVGVVLFCISCAPETGKKDAGAPETFSLNSELACPDPFQFATGVAGLHIGLEREITVAKNDPTDEDAYRVLFVAFHDDGEDVTEVDTPFEWEIANPDFIGSFMLDTSGRRSYASLRVQEDIFDLVHPTSEEPSSTFRVCVRNQCPDASTVGRCGSMVCEPRVCTESIRVTGVVSLEGSWRFRGIARLISEVTITFRQSGRTLYTAIDEVRPVVQGSSVVFYLGDDRYEGEIHPSRTHLEGTVIRTNDLGADEPVGQWVADKID